MWSYNDSLFQFGTARSWVSPERSVTVLPVYVAQLETSAESKHLNIWLLLAPLSNGGNGGRAQVCRWTAFSGLWTCRHWSMRRWSHITCFRIYYLPPSVLVARKPYWFSQWPREPRLPCETQRCVSISWRACRNVQVLCDHTHIKFVQAIIWWHYWQCQWRPLCQASRSNLKAINVMSTINSRHPMSTILSAMLII